MARAVRPEQRKDPILFQQRLQPQVRAFSYVFLRSFPRPADYTRRLCPIPGPTNFVTLFCRRRTFGAFPLSKTAPRRGRSGNSIYSATSPRTRGGDGSSSGCGLHPSPSRDGGGSNSGCVRSPSRRSKRGNGQPAARFRSLARRRRKREVPLERTGRKARWMRPLLQPSTSS